MKEFKTTDELLDYLISKGVVVKNKTSVKKKLERNTYYSIINSYKNNFKDQSGNYLSNVSFEEIYALYKFDKNLKSIIAKYVLEIEILIKSLIANHISEKYGLKDYLDINNLDDTANENTKKRILNIIEEEITRCYGTHLAITHYKDKYGFIPPFVLTKVLTFGIMSSYYGLLKQRDRQAIAKYFRISEKLLKQILKNLTSVRNISCHTDRLFCFRDKYTLSFKQIDITYKSNDNFTNLYMVVRSMELLLEKRQYRSLTSAINKEIKTLSNKLVSINISDILRIMGYPNE